MSIDTLFQLAEMFFIPLVAVIVPVLLDQPETGTVRINQRPLSALQQQLHEKQLKVQTNIP